MPEARARCGKLHVASIGRRRRDEILQSDLREQRAIQHARHRTILVELASGVGRRVCFDLASAHSPHEHLDEWTFVPIVARCWMTLKHARCYRTPLAGHVGLLPATITNSPGIR